ncbi:MAG: restriction endonuclease subunit S [Candidatus Thiodiazotropha endolucinida]|nr:restriction endonuclease subunit S [Candidatus Thiodiazotropha taylori]MCW4263338.1 restriction endonuclease subunit S [Candidatus Thiodiazotropha endolucinida]
MSNLNLPSGWTTTTLGTFMDFKNGVNADKDAYGKGIKFVNVMDIFRKNCLSSDDVIGSVEITEKQLNEYSVVRGDILFNRTSETPEEIAFSSVYLGEEKITFGGFVIRGRQTKQLLLPEFAKYCFKTDTIRKEMIRRSQGAVRANIGQKDLSKVPIVIPTETDQQIIVSILDEWRHMIEKTEALIDAKERQFGWLVTRLINRSGHKKKQLSDFISEVSMRNRDNEIDRVLSVTNRNGFVLPEDQFERRVASANVTNYKIVQQGQYAYNPSRINVGSIARLDDWDNGILSPMYTVFKLDQKMANSDYFLHWLSSSEAKQRIKKSAQGSVRETVSFGDLGAIPICLPELSVQQNIANTLNTAKEEIKLLKKLADQYRTQKRGLMQKLLSGEWHIKNKEAA